MDVPTTWKSKTMTRVVLSSTEAEYCGISELVKEILYVLKILEHLNIEVELPVKIYVDNIGAIHMARNNCNSKGTRLVNIRYHFCREVHGTLIVLIFVRSEDNEANIMTKNATKAENECCTMILVDEVPDFLINAEGELADNRKRREAAVEDLP